MGSELGLGIPGGGGLHIAGVGLAEVALGIDIRVQQGLIAPGQSRTSVS